MTEQNEMFDRVDAFIKEYGFVTGQELLDITDNDIALQHAYAAYWDAIVIPDLADKIKRKIEAVEK